MKSTLKKVGIVLGGLFAVMIIFGVILQGTESDQTTAASEAEPAPTVTEPAPTVTETVEVEVPDEAHARELDEREAALDERQDELDERESELDEATAALEEREAAVAEAEVAPEPEAEPEPEDGSGGIGDGTHLVGEDIEPGEYRADGGEFCYWERLSGTGGELDDIIANDLGAGSHVVAIAESDNAFSTQGCGEWEKVS